MEVWHFKVKKYFHFPLYGTVDSGNTWKRLDSNNLFALSDSSGKPAQSIFAASNSALLETAQHRWILFVAGGKIASLMLLEFIDNPNRDICRSACSVAGGAKLPLSTGPTAGGFSLAESDIGCGWRRLLETGRESGDGRDLRSR
jgi:hypothetical protein